MLSETRVIWPNFSYMTKINIFFISDEMKHVFRFRVAWLAVFPTQETIFSLFRTRSQHIYWWRQKTAYFCGQTKDDMALRQGRRRMQAEKPHQPRRQMAGGNGWLLANEWKEWRMTSLLRHLGNNATKMKKDDVTVQIEDLARRMFSSRLVFGVCGHAQIRIPGSKFAHHAWYRNMHLSWPDRAQMVS